MSKIKKFFCESDLTWKKIIIFAIVIGIYTGIMALLPFTEYTSFEDISISFEWWVLFGVFIILNSKSPLDAGVKCFVFFLISQPVVYLVQVPFSSEGWGIFQYYPRWFKWTLLTFPMGCIGHFLKKDKWWGMLILTPVMCFVGYHYISFLTASITAFPYHILSALFCAVTIVLYPVITFNNKKIKTAGLIIAALILIGGTVASITADHTFYNATILYSEDNDKYFDQTYDAALEDSSYGTVSIAYDEESDCFVINAEFKRPGSSVLTLTSPDGKTTKYNLTVSKNTYDLTPVNEK